MKVWPTSDKARKYLKHPVSGGFRAEGGANWQDDAYTTRRLMDGDITTDDPSPKQAQAQKPAQPQPKRGPQSQDDDKAG